MAEFCLECWNRINETNDGEERYVISKELDLCEGCGEWKRVIICERRYYNGYTLGAIILLIDFILEAICFLFRLPISIIKKLKIRKQKKEKKHPRV